MIYDFFNSISVDEEHFRSLHNHTSDLTVSSCKWVFNSVHIIPEFVLGPGPAVVVPEEADDGRGHDGEHHDGGQDGHDHSLRGNWNENPIALWYGS